MADAKISQLPVATTPLAGTELVPVVQGGVTVQTTVGDVLTGAVPSGTANGVLYLNGSKVVTSGSVLTFDGANLGVGATTPVTGYRIRVQSGNDATGYTATNASGGYASFGLTSAVTSEGFVNATNAFFFQLGGSEQMRLTSTGLGIGTNNPGAKLDIGGTNNTVFFKNSGATTGYALATVSNTGGVFQYGVSSSTGTFWGSGNAGNYSVNIGTTSNVNLGFGTNDTLRMLLDASGNLGLGVTPSASTRGKGFDIGLSGGLYGDGITFNHSTHLTSNAYPLANGSWIYKNSSQVAQLYSMQSDGSHLWFTAPSGTAGNPISFSQVMTLDASGNLLVGTTAVSTRFTLNVSGANDGITLRTTNEGAIGQLGMVNPGSNNDIQIGTLGVNNLRFFTNGTANERARITSGGYFKASNDGVYVNSTGTFHEFSGDGTAETLLVDNTISASAAVIVHTRGAANFAGKHYIAENLGTSVFEVAANGDVTNTNGTYGTISDAKMKTDIVDAGSQWSDIKALRFRKFKMKNDPSGLVQLGVVAQEVEQTSPGLVDEHADKDAEGNDLGTTTKSVKTSVLLMKAAVALQEAMARIEVLEAKVAALEA